MVFKWIKRVLLCSTAMSGGYYMAHWSNFVSEKDQGILSEDIASYIYLPEFIGNDLDEQIESSYIFWKRNNLPTYWKLLMLCKSKDHKVRLKAVESLSNLTALEKWQYIVIAQACAMNTAIGLARNFNTSPYFFFSPPFKDLDKGNLQNELFNILSSLSFSEGDICMQNLVKQVIKSAKLLLKNGYHVDLEIGDPSVIFHSQQKRKDVFFYDRLCLQAILACSAKSSLRNTMMGMGILKLLLKVLQFHKEDIEIHSLIAQILANLAIEEKMQKCFHLTGWIGILSEWKKSPFINVNLPAAKALANLDKDDIAHPVYEDGVYILSPLCRLSEKDVSADVVFIHGLLGATFWTWRQCDTQKSNAGSVIESEALKNIPVSTKYSMCWPKDWLAAEFPSLRIISLDYKSCLSNWSSCCPQIKQKDSINRTAKELIEKLLLSYVGEKPIIWIAHSMGGLIVKQILTEAFESKDEKIQSLAKRTIGIVFYSVPHKGSELASKINSASLIFQPSSEIGELKKDSPSLLSLHEKFKNLTSKYNIPILSFGETKKSRWGLDISVLVSADSANPGFGQFYTLPVDHLSTCKPVSSQSPEYLEVLNFLREHLNKISINDKHRRMKTDIFEISKVMCLVR